MMWHFILNDCRALPSRDKYEVGAHGGQVVVSPAGSPGGEFGHSHGHRRPRDRTGLRRLGNSDTILEEEDLDAMAVAAIFDIDGTLVSFNFDVRGTRKALIEELNSRGIDVRGLDLSTPTQGILDAAKERMGGGSSRYEDYRRKVFSILDAFELEGASKTTPFPGVRKALLDLKENGVRLGVLTNSGKKSATEALKRAALVGIFEFVLTREDTETMKPKPEGLEKAASMLSMQPGEVYYIGDSPFDIMAARQAGLKIVSVATGSYTAERLKNEGADFVISSLAELGPVLGVQPK